MITPSVGKARFGGFWRGLVREDMCWASMRSHTCRCVTKSVVFWRMWVFRWSPHAFPLKHPPATVDRDGLMSGLRGRGLSSAPRLDEGGLIFQGGLKEVNFKLRVVYKVTGYVARRTEIRSTCTVRGDGGWFISQWNRWKDAEREEEIMLVCFGRCVGSNWVMLHMLCVNTERPVASVMGNNHKPDTGEWFSVFSYT